MATQSLDEQDISSSFDNEQNAGSLDYEQDAGSLGNDQNAKPANVSQSVHTPIKVSKDPTLESYFCQAVEYNYDIALKAILTKATDPSSFVNKDYNVKGIKHFMPLLIACEKGHIKIVEILLQNGGAKSLQKHNKHKWNCLHTACKAGDFQMVKLLCEHASKELPEKVRKTVLNGKSKKGHNIVHIAAQYSLECLKVLQSSHCVSSDLFLATDKQGWNVLHRACAGGNIDTLKWLLELRTTLHSNIDASNSPNASKYVLAPSDEGYSNELPLLFGADQHDAKNKNGSTPLLVACEYQHKEMVEYLLGLESVDPTASTSTDGSTEGNTGLHIAAIHDSPEIADLLISHGCPTRAPNKQGDTALHIARRRSSFEVADILRIRDAGLQQLKNNDGKRAEEITPEEVTPPEILKRGPEAMRAFHKALREGKQKLPQCKLLVLGEARVGKTSLLRNMTGREFVPNLDPTRGIENQCIKTMIDSANIDVTNWKAINKNEQANRDQENYVKAIAEALRKEDPALLETEMTKNIPGELDAEHNITEDELLSQICEHLEQLYQAEHQRIQIDRYLTSTVEKHGTIEDSTQISADIQATFVPRLRPVVPQVILDTQTISPQKQQKQHTADQSSRQPPPKAVREKTSFKRSSVPPTYVPVPSTVPSLPQPQPTITQVPQRSGLGRRIVRTLYNQIPSVVHKTDEPTLCLEALDFAGQNVYRPMHHCFMSRRAIYVVVCNLQHLCNKKKSVETFADLKYWLNSIHAHVHNPGYKYEKYIFLVGTHKNPESGQHEITDGDLEKLSYDLQKYLFGENFRFKDEIHFYSNTHLIITGLENSQDRAKSGIEIIKKEIEMFSQSLPFLAEKYPIKWLNFRAKLLIKHKLDGSPILNLTEADQIAKDCGVDEPAMHTALQLFHDSGVIIYPAALKSIFLEDSEKEQINAIILMEPHWLIDIMKKVMEVKMSHPVLRNTDIDQLLTTGRTTAEFLFKLWQDDHHGNDDRFQLICLLMRAHGLMQAIKSSDKSVPEPTHTSHNTELDYLRSLTFLIPCMLSKEEPKFNSKGYTFYFDFKGFLPQEVFHCLICLVIKKCQEPPPKCWANACIWYCMEGYDWNVQLLSGEQSLKVVISPRKRKPGGMKPLECLSHLHQEYIRPICEQSGLPGLCYTAGPVVDVCTGAAPPHSTGVLAAVCYPAIGSTNIETLCKCGTCGEEYDINDVLRTSELDTSDSGRKKKRANLDPRCHTYPALDEDDLIDVMEEVMDVAGKWRALGLALRLRSPDLDMIEKKCGNSDPTECLRGTLQAWLQQRYDVQKHGPPSWDILYKAVKARAGGNNPALADKIAKTHQCTCNT